MLKIAKISGVKKARARTSQLNFHAAQRPKSQFDKYLRQNITYVKSPGDFVRPWIGPDVALKVDVVALLDVGPIQGSAQA